MINMNDDFLNKRAKILLVIGFSMLMIGSMILISMDVLLGTIMSVLFFLIWLIDLKLYLMWKKERY